MSMQGKTSVQGSVALTVAMRWTDRLIAMLSTVILARLLVPADFGIIAQASLLIGLINVFMDLGVGIALIQNRNTTSEHYDTAWTMRLGQAICAALISFMAAPYAGDYFQEPRAVAVIRVLAAGIVLAAFENIGVVTFQKEMRFGLDFRFTFLKRLCGFFVTIILAAAWQSYWVLVIGALSGRVFGVLISYRMHPMRPRLSIARFAEIFAFSQWALARGIGGYLNDELHRLLVGGRASTGTMGAYTLANEISVMPSSEVLAPLYRALFPTFVQAREIPEELKRIYLLALGLQTMLVIPASVGLALVATEVVTVLFGAKWMLAVPFLQVLALAQVLNALMTGSGYVLITMGEVRRSAMTAWSQVLSFAVAATIIVPHATALELAWLRIPSMFCGLLVAIWMLRSVLPELRISDLGSNILRPVLGTVVMAVAVLSLNSVMVAPALLALLVKVSLGAVTYSLAVLVFWTWSGRPRGAETYAMDMVSAFWNRRRRKR